MTLSTTLQAIELIPALVAKGQLDNALTAVHALSKTAVPVIKDPAIWKDKNVALNALTTMANNGSLDTAIEAAYTLSRVGAVLLADPNSQGHVMALLRSLAPPDAK